MYRHKPNRPHAGTHKPAELLGAHREQPAPQQRPPDVVHDHVQPCSKRRCLCVSAPERRHGQAGRQASRATSPGYTAILALTPATLTCDSLRAARPSTPSSTALAASAQPAQRTMIGSQPHTGQEPQQQPAVRRARHVRRALPWRTHRARGKPTAASGPHTLANPLARQQATCGVASWLGLAG
jgi:hypothetical protein